MPETLYATYDRILEKIDSTHCGLAKAAFRWLAFSERPLYIEEVAEATILEPTRQDRLFFPESPRNMFQSYHHGHNNRARNKTPGNSVCSQFREGISSIKPRHNQAFGFLFLLGT
jgi:hypothetical protein